MNKSSESYKVYTEKSGDATSGVCETQPEGRAGLPKAEAVKDATAEPKGTVKRLVGLQVDSTGVN